MHSCFGESALVRIRANSEASKQWRSASSSSSAAAAAASACFSFLHFLPFDMIFLFPWALFHGRSEPNLTGQD